MVYGVSNGHVTDDVKWPVIPKCSERNISKRAGDAVQKQSLLLDGLL